ncbi:MAG TPA: hypothetical protein VGM41_16420 [Chitinophagaceae bacterium]|jgi:hypothetical protein
MNILDRVNSPTPRFFTKLRNIGLVLGAVSVAIIAAPIALPAILVTWAGYIGVAAGVMTAVSQATIKRDA